VGDFMRCNTRMVGDGEQQRLIRDHMVEDAGEKRRIGGRFANQLGPNTRGGEKSPQALGLPSHET